MDKKPLPKPDVLRQLLRYDPETGKLFWIKRDVTWFTAGAKSAAWAMKKWNTRYAGQEAFTAVRNTGYLHGRIFDQAYQAHRVAWALYHGHWPAGEVDHINGIRADNRIENLRDIPKAENQRNMKLSSANKTGVSGLMRISETRWLVTAQGDYIGRFACVGQAIKARKRAERERGFHPNHGRSAA